MARKQAAPQILNADHYDQIQAALRVAESLPEECSRAEQLGIDCAEYRKMHEYAVNWLKLALRLYFPNGRPQ
jgi:hypothetical protein